MAGQWRKDLGDTCAPLASDSINAKHSGMPMADYAIFPKHSAEIEALLARALQGENVAWPSGLSDAQAEEIWALISAHGISGLLAQLPFEEIKWPTELCDSIREEARLQALWEAEHHPFMARLLEAAHAAGIPALIMKGTALAYSLYAEPAHRRRGDTDLLIRPGDCAQMREVLSKLGWVQQGQPRLAQEDWAAPSRSGFTHALDLHWAVSNAPAIAEGLAVEDFFISKQELPQLGTHAYAPSPVHQLLQASINQASHKLEGMGDGPADLLEGRRLIWACDYHLIARDFDSAQWDELIERALVARLAGTLRKGLALAADTLGTDVPSYVMDALQRGATDDRAIAYFDAPSAAKRFAADIKASKGIAAKAHVTKVHMMATPELLHARYPDHTDAPLWQLRLRRIAIIALQSAKRILP